MTASLRQVLHGLGLATAVLAAPATAADPATTAAAAHAPPPQQVLLRVGIGADGRVQNARSLDPKTPEAVLKAATEIAGKLQFTPATKDGRAIPSETSLSMTLALVPRAGGGYGMSLRKAQNGPSLVQAGLFVPKVGRENGGIVIAGADLLADGRVDMATFKIEKTELRVPSSFAEQRFAEAARSMLKDARFMLDKVEGIEVPAHISMPMVFNGGARRLERDALEEDYGESQPAPRREEDEKLPSLSAVSRIAGIALPKIDYTAPPAAPAAK
jgi:hypothetical protein